MQAFPARPVTLPLHLSELDIPEGYVDLCGPVILKDGRKYVPLIRESLGLACSLNIIFMRKEPPGAILTNLGDLDNRLKTLFDGLRHPMQPEEFEGGEPIETPLFCLMDNDARITSFSVETDRLFTRPEDSRHRVHLVIEVTVRVIDYHHFNTAFLTG